MLPFRARVEGSPVSAGVLACALFRSDDRVIEFARVCIASRLPVLKSKLERKQLEDWVAIVMHRKWVR
jgi:hypothetical protein